MRIYHKIKKNNKTNNKNGKVKQIYQKKKK